MHQKIQRYITALHHSQNIKKNPEDKNCLWIKCSRILVILRADA
jgi:hypothetical protein